MYWSQAVQSATTFAQEHHVRVHVYAKHYANGWLYWWEVVG